MIYTTLESTFEKLTRISLPITKDRAKDSIVQHSAVLEALRSSNGPDARRLMSEHDQDVLASVKAYQFQNIHLFK